MKAIIDIPHIFSTIQPIVLQMEALGDK